MKRIIVSLIFISNVITAVAQISNATFIDNFAASNSYNISAIKSNQLSANFPDIILINCPTTIKDVDGNVYKTVTIGTQCWLQQNLKTTRYNDKSIIDFVSVNAAWLSMATGAYCNYNNDTNKANSFGRLYNWYAVNTDRLCPSGWHVPGDSEWTTLTDCLGGELVAGGKMKEAGTEHWKSPNNGATNSSDFGALPGGYRFYYDGTYSSNGSYRLWWSSTELGKDRAWSRSLSYSGTGLFRGCHYKLYGYSVRCIRDQN